MISVLLPDAVCISPCCTHVCEHVVNYKYDLRQGCLLMEIQPTGLEWRVIAVDVISVCAVTTGCCTAVRGSDTVRVK